MIKKIPNIPFNYNKGLNGFEIMSISELANRTKNVKVHSPSQPHRLNFYMIIYITQGRGHHMVDFNHIPLKKGTLIFIAPSQVHSFENINQCEGYICIFTDKFFIEASLQLSDRYIIDNLYFKDITKALVLEDESIEDFFHLLQKEFLTMQVSKKLAIVSSLLHATLIKSVYHFSNEAIENESSELFSAFKKALLTKYSYIHYAEEYAALLKVSSKHLNLTCKQLTGYTTKAFIDRFMIIEIKRYLISSTLPIKDIASKMGYLEVSNFLKFFKKHTNLTPKAFRNLYK